MKPYGKAKNLTIYINIKLNHTSTIIKHVYKSVANRVTTNSSNIKNSNKAKTAYETAKKKTNYAKYNNNNNTKRTRNVNITLLNPSTEKLSKQTIFSQIKKKND